LVDGGLSVTDWLSHEVQSALWWVVPFARFLCLVLRSDEGDAPAECRGCALVCGPFLRGAPVLSEDERAELWSLVEAHLTAW
jgi:hypothetical protein